MTRIIYSVLIIFTCLSCYEIDRDTQYPDPLAQLFFGKHTQMMVAHHEGFPSLSDSSYFDSAGNIIEVKGFGFHEFREFDTLHFVTRLLRKSEEYKNYSITYKMTSNGILQTWHEINHFDWSFSEKDLDSQHSYVVKMEVDDGLLTKEVNESRGVYTLYDYDDDSS
jgi:hypothetical protein